MKANLKDYKLCQDFNAKYPPGTAVKVHKDDGSILETKTRSEAWMLGADSRGYQGHTAVVSVEGISGGYMLNRVTPISS